MNRKKVKIIILCVIIISLIVFLFVTNIPNYKIIVLDKEPDYIGSNDYSNELAVVTDGELVLYDEQGVAHAIDTDIRIAKAFPLEHIIWVIDVENNLYQITYGENKEIEISDVILTDVEIVECDNYQTVAITTKGDLYVWGENISYSLGFPGQEHIDEPTKVDNLSNVKQCVLHNGSTVVLTNEGNVYVAGSNIKNTSFLNQYTKLNQLEDIENLYGNGDFIYTQKTDGSILMWRSIDFETDEVVLIGQIMEERTASINSKHIKRISTGIYYAIGVNDEGEVYYWGLDVFTRPTDKGGHKNIRTIKELPGLEAVDDVYGGCYIAYVKKGLTIYIISEN